MKIRAISGEEFEVIDSQGTNNSRLREFRPNEPLSSGIKLPRYYFAINSTDDFSRQLAPNFELRELLSSERDSLTFPYYIPIAIIRLAEAAQALRAKLGNQPISLSNAYRSPFHPFYQGNNINRVSAHRFGTALDITKVGDNPINSDADHNLVYGAAFDNGLTSIGARPSGRSSLGFEFAESRAQMGGTVTHAHLDMGYITQDDELDFVRHLLVDDQDDGRVRRTGRVNPQFVTTNLNFRSQPNTFSNNIIGEIAPEAPLTIIGEEVTGGNYTFSGSPRNDWYEIEFNGQRGFVAAAFVEIVTEGGNGGGNNVLPFPLDTSANISELATILMSEASIGNATERQAVGWTVLTRMARRNTQNVSDVSGAYARNQSPTQAMRDLARDLLRGNISDPTQGATHFYSPISMPKEGQSTGGFDIGGGLELVPPLTQRNWKPAWAVSFPRAIIPGVRPHFYKFHIAPGTGPVA